MTTEPTDEKEPFADDKLDRKKAAEFLTSYLLGRHAVAGNVKGNESFVLNVNAEWGLGKTYFLTEWAKMLRKRGHSVVYFDAWENDYTSNPFVGFMSEIEQQLTLGLGAKQKLVAKAKAVAQKGARVIKASAPEIAISFAKHLSGVDLKQLVDSAKETLGDAEAIIQRDMRAENENLRKAIHDFKDAFESFALSVGSSNNPLPVFLMVDELDRCRPSYAIDLLEHIKHVFRIRNVYTIVATDSTQLSYSINAIYGARFESRKYLRRFFDHESRLDSPPYLLLADAILEQRRMASDSRIVNVLERVGDGTTAAAVLAAIANTLQIATRDFIRAIDILDTIRLTHSEKIDLIFIGFMIMLYIGHGAIFDQYQRNPSGTSIKMELGPLVDHRITWIEMLERRDINYGYKPQAVSVYVWLMKYLEGVWSPEPENNSDSMMGLRTAIQNLRVRNVQGINQFKLQQYQSIVSLAGHFSI